MTEKSTVGKLEIQSDFFLLFKNISRFLDSLFRIIHSAFPVISESNWELTAVVTLSDRSP